MSIKDVRDAFNQAADGIASASKAYMRMERASDTEFQRLDFEGTFVADGSPFTITSDRIRPGGNLAEAARETAARLTPPAPAEQGAPPNEPTV